MKKYIAFITLLLIIGTILIESSGMLDRYEEAKAQEKELPQHAIADVTKTEQAVRFTTPQPLYIKDETLVEIGQLAPNQAFTIVQEDESYYELRFGEVPVFVKKAGARFQQESPQVANPEESIMMIQTTVKTPVYTQLSNRSAMLLQLEPGFRYPVTEEGDWFVVSIGEQRGYVKKQAVEPDVGIPVLVYHHILPKAQMTTMTSTISAESFEQQMDYLEAHSFKTIDTQALSNYLAGQSILPAATVLVTFDDGLLSTKEYAYPLLKKYEFTAIQHIISSRTHRAQGFQTFEPDGKLQFFTEQEMAAMSDVFVYEAHTFDLHQLNGNRSALFTASRDELTADLRKNIQEIPNARSLAYPFGHYNEETIHVMKELGFQIGFTTTVGYAHHQDSPYEIKRFGLTETVPMADFIHYVQGVLFSE